MHPLNLNPRPLCHSLNPAHQLIYKQTKKSPICSNDPEIPHETGLNGANGRSSTDFTKGSVLRRRPDLGRGGCADRDLSPPSGYTAPSKGIADSCDPAP
jgi:hypothetical protein